MTISDLLRQLKKLRVDLQLEGTQLRYSCPRGAMSDDLRRAIYRYKPALTEILTTAAGIAKCASYYPPESDALPKIPWLGWYLNTFDPRSHEWAITSLLEFPERVSRATLQLATNELIARHDAFRLRLSLRRDGEWVLHMAANAGNVAVNVRDFSAVPKELVLETLRSLAAEQRRLISIIEGPVIGVAMCRLPESQGDAVLLTVHHDIADGHSMEVIVRDLISIYQNLIASNSPGIRPDVLSYREYLFRAQSLMHSNEFLRDSVAFWLASDRLQRQLSLPHDFSSGRHTVSTSRSVDTILDAGIMKQLALAAAKRGVPLHELFIYALCGALYNWTGSRYLHLDVEHHGRSVLGPATVLTETVGPMTVKAPLLLNAQEVVGDFASLSRELHDTVEHGLGYGFLRYCCEDPAVRQRFASCVPAQVLLNNRISVGQRTMGVDVPERQRVRVGGLGAGASPGQDDLVSHEILTECDGSIDGARINWTYSNTLHREKTIQSLAKNFRATLHSFT